MAFHDVVRFFFGDQPKEPLLAQVSLTAVSTPPVVPTAEVPALAKVKPVRVAPSKPAPSTAEVQLKEFIRAVEFVSLATAKRSSLPILGCVHISPRRIRATDLEVDIEITVPWLDIPEVCVPADRLKKGLKMVKAPLKCEVKGFNLHINGLIITGFDPMEYLARPTISAHKMGKPFLVPARLPDVFVAVNPNESRPQLCGILLDFDRGKIVGSDGHRLHLATLVEPHKSKPNVIVPALACRIIEKLLKRGEVSGIICGPIAEGADETIAPTTLIFNREEITVTARPVEGEFPDYTQVIPKKAHSILLKFHKPELVSALKACQVLTTDRDRGVQIQQLSPGVATVSCEQIDGGSVSNDIPVTVREGQWVVGNGFGINVEYALEAAESIRGNTVALRYVDETSPLHFSPKDNKDDGDLQVVVMPMRVLSGEVTPQRPEVEVDIKDADPHKERGGIYDEATTR